MYMTVKPNRYILGAKPELSIYPKTPSGIFFVPAAMRISVKQPDGLITTFSGGDFTQATDYLFVLYQPQIVGWYEYEAWIQDSNGREAAATNGFEVLDRVR